MTVDAGLVAAGAALLIPLLNAILTKPSSSGTVRSLVAVVLAGVTAVGAKVADVHGAVSVKQLIVIGAAALIGAGGMKWSWLQDVEDWLRNLTGKIGLG